MRKEPSPVRVAVFLLTSGYNCKFRFCDFIVDTARLVMV